MLAVIPNVVLFGPLALLALVFPPLAAFLAYFLRRWRVVLVVVSVDTTLLLVHSWLRGFLRGSWWGERQGLCCAMGLVALAAIPFAWRRAARAGDKSRPAGVAPRRIDLRRLLPFDAVLLGAGGMAGLGLAVTGPARVEAAQVVWMFEQVERGAILSSPVVADDAVYVSAIRDLGLTAGGVVYRLDRATGKAVWQFDDGGKMQHVYSSPCVAGGRLFVGEGMHANFVCKLYCLDAATGRKLWDYRTSSHIESTPCAAGGRVYVGAGDDGVYCFEAESGRVCWHWDERLHVDVSLRLVGDRLYGGSGVSRKHRTTEVFCLDARDGRPLWRTPTELPVWGSPEVDGNQVFVGLGEGRLTQSLLPPGQREGAVLCLSALDGQRLWRYPVADAVVARPAADAQSIYVGGRDGFCYCLDRQGGRLRWKQALGSSVVTSVALAPNRLYAVASEGRVCRLDAATGAVGWTFDVAQASQTRPRLFSSPSVESVPAPGSPARRLYFGAELRGVLNSAAVLYCLSDDT